MTQITYIRNDILFCDTGEDMEEFYKELKALERERVVRIISMRGVTTH